MFDSTPVAYNRHFRCLLKSQALFIPLTESTMPLILVFIVCAVIFPIASAVAAQAQDKPAIKTHRVVEITPPNGINSNEVSIAINPTNENNIVAVAMLRDYQTEKEKNVALSVTFRANHDCFARCAARRSFDSSPKFAPMAILNVRLESPGDLIWTSIAGWDSCRRGCAKSWPWRLASPSMLPF